MNVFLDEFEDQKLEAIFDSYCKAVIRNAGRNIRKRYLRLLKNELLVDFSSGGFLEEMSRFDDLPSDKLFIVFEEKNYAVTSIELYEKLVQLPHDQLEVLILKYWCGKTDQQIADEKKSIGTNRSQSEIAGAKYITRAMERIVSTS